MKLYKEGGKFEVANKKVRFGKSGIHIDPKNKGTFTSYCKSKGYGGVTSACIAEGKRSSNPTTRKRATFAGSARSWKKK